MRTFPILALLLVALPPQGGIAQRSFSDSSGLSNPAYVRDRIREISDADLWESLDLSRPGLEGVREAVTQGRPDRAAEAWGTYWETKKRPSYVTQTDHLFLDTDMLTDTARFRSTLESLPEERDTILARASMMLRGAIRPWGDTTIEFGPHVNFDAEVGQSGKYGFHYWMWSRPLIMAYVLTRDESYPAAFDRLFNQWYEQRNGIHSSIPGLDVVYYELGLGMRNRMFIENYMLPFRGRTTGTHRRMLKTILSAGRWLYELERWEGYRPGNWQVHGSYMLVQMALAFPEFRESPAWLAIGLRRLLEHMKDDFYADGGHSERAPRNYTLATYLNYRNAAYLLDAYGVRPDVKDEIRRALGRTIDWWLTMIAPTGEVPAINDSHRGLFPAVILRDGARLFDKPEAYGVLRNLFGEPGHESAPLPKYVSRNMPASGFCVMRTDWTPEALYMTVNYGPSAGFHTHFDLLDFEMYAYGRPLAIDAGVGLTYDDPLYNPWYRSSRAHNMVTVNDSSIEREGLRGEQIRWGATGEIEFFSGEHTGYRRFGVNERRQIAFVKPTYWFVLDDVRCEHSGDTLSWYFHSPGKLRETGSGFTSITDPGIRIIPAGDRYSTRTGMGWAASSTVRIPGKTEMIPWIRFDQLSAQDSTHQFAILLAPFRTGTPLLEPARVSGRHFTVREGDVTDHLYFANGHYADSLVSTDAEFLLLRMSAGGHRTYALIEGSYLVYRGKTLFRGGHAVTREGVLPP